MFLVAAVTALHYVFMVPLALLSIFLTLVILVQRGRGGGLTGALGGMGGQSAFGTKAGDLFTRVTIVVAAVWVLLSMGALKVLNSQAETAGYDVRDVGRAATTSKDGTGKADSTKAGVTDAETAEPGATESAAPAASGPAEKSAAPVDKGTEAPAAPAGPASPGKSD